MGFNSAFKGLKLLKAPGTGVLNDPILNVLTSYFVRYKINIYVHVKFRSTEGE
jgi:hypothetical protein